MRNKYIHTLMRRFFENELSVELQDKFQRWFISTGFDDEKGLALTALWNDITPVANESTARDLKKIHNRIHALGVKQHVFSVKKVLRVAVIIMLPLFASLCTWLLTNGRQTFVEPELVECFVPYGERKQLTLADGSVVWLNSGSLLVYSKKFEGKERTLFLSGEANFNVTKNPDKPFIVKTGYVDVEALGTIFNVQSYADSENVVATLEEGSIKVSNKHTPVKSIILAPDEQVVYAGGSGKFKKVKVDSKLIASWKYGNLIFQGASLGSIIKSLERHFGVTINFDAGKYAGRSFNVKFSPDENLTQALDVLKEIVIGLTYKIKGDVVFIN